MVATLGLEYNNGLNIRLMEVTDSGKNYSLLWYLIHHPDVSLMKLFFFSSEQNKLECLYLPQKLVWYLWLCYNLHEWNTWQCFTLRFCFCPYFIYFSIKISLSVFPENHFSLVEHLKIKQETRSPCSALLRSHIQTFYSRQKMFALKTL